LLLLATIVDTVPVPLATIVDTVPVLLATIVDTVPVLLATEVDRTPSVPLPMIIAVFTNVRAWSLISLT